MATSDPIVSRVSPPPRVRVVSVVALTLVAVASSFTLFTSYVGIINVLPRPMQGESVMIPWSVCLVGYLVLPALLPWLVSLLFVNHRGLRLYFLFCLQFATVLVWYFAFTKKPFSATDFAEWYDCPNATLTVGNRYSDDSNWSGGDVLTSGKKKWYFVCRNEMGHRVKGEAIIETLPHHGIACRLREPELWSGRFLKSASLATTGLR